MSKAVETQETKTTKGNKETVKSNKETTKGNTETKTTLEAVVYVGPAMKGLKTNTTYARGIPKIAEELIETNPAIKKMFVKVSEVAEAKRQLANKNSALSIIYKKISESEE